MKGLNCDEQLIDLIEFMTVYTRLANRLYTATRNWVTWLSGICMPTIVALGGEGEKEVTESIST